MSEITIEVTQADIEHGVRDDPCNCPIALAVDRAFDQPGFVEVTEAGLMVSVLGDYVEMELPETATLFVQAFDTGEPVHPFTFTVSVP